MKIRKQSIIGATFTFAAGTVLHFVYSASDCNVIAGIFAPVNESVWEHLKLLYFPFIIYSLFEYIIGGRKVKNFTSVKFLSIVIGMAVILAVHYMCEGILGKSVLALDIAAFAAGVASAFCFSYFNIQTDRYSSRGALAISLFGFVSVTVCFILFTFSPPHIPLFQDMMTGRYGI